MANPVFKNIYSFAKKCGNCYTKDPAKFLSRSMALTLGVSSIAETIAVCINDKISNHEKKFLVPQEIVEGIITFSLFLAFTSPFEAVFKKAVAKGKLLPKSCKDYSLDKIQQELSTKGSELQKFQKGATMVGNLFATLISVGTVIPIVRNYSASKIRNFITRNDKKPTNKPNDCKVLLATKPNFNFAAAGNSINRANGQYKNMTTFLNSTRKPLFR